MKQGKNFRSPSRWFLFLGLFVMLAFWTIPAIPASAQTIELKFAHQNPPKGRTTVKFLDPWMKKVEEATQGKVKIISYPAQSLAKAKETFAAVEGGVADMGWAPIGYFAGRFPLTDVMTLPFIPLPGAEKNSRILQELYDNSPEMQKHFSTVKLLFMHTSDPYAIMTTKKPVRNMSDLKGLKIRALGAIPSDALKRLGASPLVIPMPGVYEAAEKGVIDGAALPWAAVATFRLYEVFDYWTDVNTWLATFFVIMNKDKWESLPPDIQKGIMSVSGVAGAEFGGRSGWGPDIYKDVETKLKQTGRKMERVTLDAGELEKWKKLAGEPVWDAWADRMESKGLPGKKTLSDALKQIEKYK